MLNIYTYFKILHLYSGKNKRENPFRACREKVLQESFFHFTFARFDRLFSSEKENSQNMFWNIHLESVNLKNYSLICEAFKWELRVGESESFFEPENLGLRDFLKIQSWKLKKQNNYDPLTHAYEL